MIKNEQFISDIFVKKIVQKQGQFLTRNELRDIWIRTGGSKIRFSYGLSLLTSGEVALSVSQGMYQVGNTPIEDAYWRYIVYLMKSLTAGAYVISGEKSMEIHMKNFSIPDVLVLYTRDLTKRIRLSNGLEIHLRSLSTGEKSGKLNLFRKMTTDMQRILYESAVLPILSLEGSLLDSAFLHRHGSGIDENLINRFLSRYGKILSRDRLGELVGLRYIRSANRLRAFAKETGEERLYAMMLDIIKKEGGGCYISI